MIVILKPEEVVEYWDKCRPFIERAFEHRVNTDAVDDYIAPLIQGKCQLWVYIDKEEIKGCVITNLEKGSKAKVCNILKLGADDFMSWGAAMESKIAEFAKTNGCAALQYIGRKGFSGLNPDYKEDGTVFIKELNYE